MQTYALLGDANHMIPILKRLLRLPFGTSITPARLGLDPILDHSATIRVFRNWPRKRNRKWERTLCSSKSVNPVILSATAHLRDSCRFYFPNCMIGGAACNL